MSRIPSLSRLTLDALAVELITPKTGRVETTTVRRAFVTLLAARHRQARALAAVDRIAEDAPAADADAATLAAMQMSADRLADEVADQAAAVLLAPIERVADLRLKLAVLIAASEPHPADAHAFPALYLRALLADLREERLGLRR